MGPFTGEFSWVEAGKLCNCNGEGTDTLLITIVDPTKCSCIAIGKGGEPIGDFGPRGRVVVVNVNDVDVGNKGGMRKRAAGFGWWENVGKLHREFLTEEEKDFTLQNVRES